MEKMPENYKEGIPRVSDIVSSAFPFAGTENEKRFLEWLAKYGVSHADYMKEASTGGTAVHSSLEEIMKKGSHVSNPYTPWIFQGSKFLYDYKVRPIYVEHYITSPRYQGTVDLVAEIGGEKYVLDWKNWGLAKAKFGIPKGEYRKPYDKLKKAQLQLSMYAHVLGINKIAVIELQDDAYYFYEMEVLPESVINEAIADYELMQIEKRILKINNERDNEGFAEGQRDAEDTNLRGHEVLPERDKEALVL